MTESLIDLPEVFPVKNCKIRSKSKPPGISIMDHIHDTNLLESTKETYENHMFTL